MSSGGGEVEKLQNMKGIKLGKLLNLQQVNKGYCNYCNHRTRPSFIAVAVRSYKDIEQKGQCVL